jgi:DNA-binding FrmR family transcriptional regulator
MKCDNDLVHRIRRLEGQMTGIRKMMETSNACQDLVVQLKAVRANIDKTISILTTKNLQQVMEVNPQDQEAFQEALDLIVKSR